MKTLLLPIVTAILTFLPARAELLQVDLSIFGMD
jgi:hypothetical protein